MAIDSGHSLTARRTERAGAEHRWTETALENLADTMTRQVRLRTPPPPPQSGGSAPGPRAANNLRGAAAPPRSWRSRSKGRPMTRSQSRTGQVRPPSRPLPTGQTSLWSIVLVVKHVAVHRSVNSPAILGGSRARAARHRAARAEVTRQEAIDAALSSGTHPPVLTGHVSSLPPY